LRIKIDALESRLAEAEKERDRLEKAVEWALNIPGYRGEVQGVSGAVRVSLLLCMNFKAELGRRAKEG
jgi:hypothetical protein